MFPIRIGAAVLGAVIVCSGGVAAGQQHDGRAKQDKAFLKAATQESMAEIDFSKLALLKSQNADVRGFAQKMVDDHAKLIADMKPIAKRMGVHVDRLLTRQHDMEMAQLRRTTGGSFDRAYVKRMVEDHQKQSEAFLAEERSTQDGELKQAIAQAEQIERQHTQMIDGIAQKEGIATLRVPESER